MRVFHSNIQQCSSDLLSSYFAFELLYFRAIVALKDPVGEFC